MQHNQSFAVLAAAQNQAAAAAATAAALGSYGKIMQVGHDVSLVIASNTLIIKQHSIFVVTYIWPQ